MIKVEFTFKGPGGIKSRIKEFNNRSHYKFYCKKIPDVDQYGYKLIGQKELFNHHNKNSFFFTIEERKVRQVRIEATDFDSALALLNESGKNKTTNKLPGETISNDSLVISFDKFENKKSEK